MAYVDVHAHLDFDAFNDNREELIKQLEDNNIYVLTNTLNPQNYEETKPLFKNTNHVSVCPGLYPQEAESIDDKAMDTYLQSLRDSRDSFLAIGEVGLDRHNTKDNQELFDLQEKRFKQMIELAIELDKPMLIHTRKAEARVLEILSEYVEKTGFKKFDLHCFTGRKKHIKTIKELGIYCSIPLSVLNTESFQILVENLPVRQLLVETDSPYQSPLGFPNSSLNVPKIYEKIAQIKGYDTKEIETIIYRNYQRFIT